MLKSVASALSDPLAGRTRQSARSRATALAVAGALALITFMSVPAAARLGSARPADGCATASSRFVATQRARELPGGGRGLPFARTSTPPRAAAAAEPILVADVWPGSAGAAITGASAVGQRLFFSANDGIHGQELWMATPHGGAQLVKDIWTGPGSSFPAALTAVGGVLLFTADDGIKGTELWSSDGTDAGTVRVRDFAKGPHSSGIEEIRAAGQVAYLSVHDYASDPGKDIARLWKTDGTEGGTTLVRSWVAQDVYGPTEITPAGSMVYFVIDGALWKSDGTWAGTARVRGSTTFIGAFDLMSVGTRLFFDAYPPSSGCAGPDAGLWVTMGSKASTKALGGAADEGIAFQGRLYYAGPSALSVSDGTLQGTRTVRELPKAPSSFVIAGGQLFFVTGLDHWGDTEAKRLRLWSSDGTTTGTGAIHTFRHDSDGYVAIGDLVAWQGRIAFHAWAAGAGEALWTSDGREAHTDVLSPLGSPEPRNAHQLVPVGDSLFFVARSDTSGEELWVVTDPQR